MFYHCFPFSNTASFKCTHTADIFLPHSVLSSCLGGDLQTTSGTAEEGGLTDNRGWEEERELERLACEGDDFVPPKIMVRDKTFLCFSGANKQVFL